MNGFVRHLRLMTLWVGICPALLFAQGDSSTAFVAYACQHKSCDEVASILRPLLPEASRDPSVQLVVDRDGNRLLLSGPSYVHNIAQRLVSEVDKPRASFATSNAVNAKLSMHSYKLPTRLHEAFVREIKNKFGTSVRVSSDLASENVFVSAASDQHSSIAQLAASYTGQIQTSLPDSRQPIRYRENRGATSGGNVERPETPSTDYSRFIRIPAGQIDRVQQQLMAVFSSRLQVATVNGSILNLACT